MTFSDTWGSCLGFSAHCSSKSWAQRLFLSFTTANSTRPHFRVQEIRKGGEWGASVIFEPAAKPQSSPLHSRDWVLPGGSCHRGLQRFSLRSPDTRRRSLHQDGCSMGLKTSHNDGRWSLCEVLREPRVMSSGNPQYKINLTQDHVCR